MKRYALDQGAGGPRCEFGSEMSIPPTSGTETERPVEAKSIPPKFDCRVDNDDVVASDREARWNGKRRVGACWCNGLFGARQARLLSRTQAWRV